MDNKMGFFNKRDALNTFTNRLLASKIRNSIGEIVLFGSLAKKDLRPESDIDLLIFGTDNLHSLRKICSEISYDVIMKYNESVEPLVYCIDQLRYPHSYFLYQAMKNGKEIYKMRETELKRQEAQGYLRLAMTYLKSARFNYRHREYRITVDTGYNAAELCVKGMLLFKMKDLPFTYQGLIGKFGELYIKTGKVTKETGHALNQAFHYRNHARYDYHATIDKEEAHETLKLAKDLMSLLDKRI